MCDKVQDLIQKTISILLSVSRFHVGSSVIGKGVIGFCAKYGLRYRCWTIVELVKERKMSKRQNPGLPGRTIMRHFSKLWHRHFLAQFF